MIRAPRRTGLVFFPAYDWAISPSHPERQERLLYTQDQVLEEGLLDVEGIVEYKVRQATYKDIQRVHFCVPDERAVTTESHLISAGGCIVAGDAVLKGDVESAFALVRPPGHHAMRVVHGNRGFCNVNIEAIMIEYLRDTYGIRRVAIVDTDCHHGDGTQDIYWHDPDTLFISLHQDGRTLYPGTGFPEESGGPNARGTTINIPLPPQTGEEGFLYTLEELVMPLIEQFEPELIVNSAGQDNHFTDPITNMNFSARGYASLNARLKPHIAVLEGGYAVEDALPYVNVGIIMAMAGLDTSLLKEPNYDRDCHPQREEVTRYIHELIPQLKDIYLSRAFSAETFEEGRIIEGTKTIYYDTDGIQERRNERVRYCTHCSGTFSIESSASNGRRIFGVHVPTEACSACQKTGLSWFEKASLDKTFNHVYLQDRTRGLYEIR